MIKYILILVSCGAFSLAVTPLARQMAIRAGAIDIPGGRHIHDAPTPRFGGLAVYVAIVFGLAFACSVDSFVRSELLKNARGLYAVMVGATAVMFVGLIDDRYSLRPAIKLFVEIGAGIIAVAAGFRIGNVLHVQLGWFDASATVLWIVVVTNAVNMIDGLDGLATGVGLIISVTLFSISVYLAQVHSALVLAALSGALFGFLCYNLPPARIFLGDSGSLLIGFLLAVTAIDSTNKAATVVAILAPLLALGLPLAELILTTARRILRIIRVVPLDNATQHYKFSILGRPALFAADRDHIHHRLLALGATRRLAVVVLYATCAIFGAMTLVLVSVRSMNLALLLAVFAIVATSAIRRLGYKELQLFKSGVLLPLFDLPPAANRRLIIVLFDLAFISASYLGAFMIRYGGLPPSARAQVFFEGPLLACVQMGCFMLSGLYGRSYRHAGITDLLAALKTLAIALTLSWLAVLFAEHLRPPSLSLAILDAYLLATLIIGSRLSFRILDYLFSTGRTATHRVVIYGAGNGGVAALREIRSNPALGMDAIAFLDDDPNKSGFILQGLPILTDSALGALVEQQALDEVIVATLKIPQKRLTSLVARFGPSGLMMRRFQIGVTDLDLPENDSNEVASTTRRDVALQLASK